MNALGLSFDFLTVSSTFKSWWDLRISFMRHITYRLGNTTNAAGKLWWTLTSFLLSQVVAFDIHVFLFQFLLKLIFISFQVQNTLRFIFWIFTTESSNHCFNTVFLSQFLEFVILDLHACTIIDIPFSLHNLSLTMTSIIIVFKLTNTFLENFHYVFTQFQLLWVLAFPSIFELIVSDLFTKFFATCFLVSFLVVEWVDFHSFFVTQINKFLISNMATLIFINIRKKTFQLLWCKSEIKFFTHNSQLFKTYSSIIISVKMSKSGVIVRKFLFKFIPKLSNNFICLPLLIRNGFFCLL